MKTMKKVFALALALIMVLGLSVTAFADGETTTYKITVTNTPSNTNVSIAGKEFNAYKIFDVTYADTDKDNTNDAYAYTISSKIDEDTDNPWFEAVMAYMGYTKGTGDDASKWGKTDEEGNWTAETEAYYTGKGLTLTPTKNDPTVYVVEAATDEDDNPKFDERDFADALTAWLNEQTNAPTADGTGKGAEVENSNPATEQAVISDLPAAGYYLVTGEGAADDNQTVVAAAALSTTDPDADINLKAGAPTLDKDIVEADDETADGASANVGDTVNFQLTSVVPDMTGYESYTYLVSDTLSSGLTPYKADGSTNYIDVSVTIGGEAYTDFTVAQAKDKDGKEIAGGFTITFTDFINQATNAGKAIVITYSATVNENALTTDAETNTATLKYSNDPYDTTTANTPETEVYVYDFDIIVDKYAGGQTVDSYTYTNDNGETVTVYSKDGKTYYTDTSLTTEATIPQNTTPTKGDAVADTSSKLSGAEFVLVKKVTDEDGETTETFYKYTAADSTTNTAAKVEWVESITEATHVTTEANGAAKFQGLEEGTYYLRETEAPDGYNMLTADEEVKITASYDTDGTIKTGEDSGTTVTKTDGRYSITSEVANSTGTELPETGGIGTTIFYVVGAVLVIGAAVLLITKKRMNGAAE